MMKTLSLIDAWRVENPSTLRYTWAQGISNKHSRLDYFLCNEQLLSISHKYKIHPKYRSDHAPISCCLTISSEKRGPGVWRLNNSLLSEPAFEKLIKKEINNFKSVYAATPYNPNYIAPLSHGFDLMIKPTLFWETLLVTLRGVIIRYGKRKKAATKRITKTLETNISTLDKKVSEGRASIEEMTQLVNLNSELIELRKEDLKGAYVRSRADWLEFGEKPSRYFLNLENRNRVNKSITEVLKDDQTVIRDQQQIIKNVKEFYEDLYKEENVTVDIDDPILLPTQLTQEEKDYLDLPLTKEEIDKALSQQKSNKSPGLDGYSAEFFKKFWPQLGHYFMECLNECFLTGNLTCSQSQGLITCLPKTGKARNLLKNWRPISLLNTTYKIISLCITNRLRPILDRIISQEQKGFLQGRTIADCTRLMYDIIWECEYKNKDGLILLVDFQKAFDSLSWKFINETLQKFNFGNDFIKWVNMFQKNSNSRIILNGYLSEPFNLYRGCRQGDPLSPYLFILCTEFLTLAFRTNKDIEGISVHNKEHKTSQYADDTSVFLKATEENLKRSLQTLTWFYQRSGLKINFTKTKVIRIGPIRETDRRFCKENNLDWVSSFMALGIQYDTKNIKNITLQNIESKIDSMRSIIQLWMYRNITPMGRICVAKSLILSKVTHVLQALPSPPIHYLKQLETMIIEFIWRKKRHEIKKETLYLNYENGGLNMVDLIKFDMALKTTWVKKLHTESNEWTAFAKEYKIDRLIWTGENYHQEIFLSCHNPFWKSVAYAYKTWYKTLRQNTEVEPRNEPLWGNTRIKIPFNKDLFKANVIYVKDLFNHTGTPLNKNDLEMLTGKNIMLTTYFALWKSLPQDWRQYTIHKAQIIGAIRPFPIEWLTKDKKGTRNIRNVWKLNEQPILPGKNKWIEELNLDDTENWEFLFMLPIKCKLNARSTYFQIQVLHRTLVTNRKLMQFNIRDNEQCDNCNDIETISHLLYECQNARRIWDNVVEWLRGISPNDMYFDKKSILLGNKKNEIIINYIIIVIKHELYKSKWTKTRLNLLKIKKIIKSHMELEIYSGTIKNSLPKVLGKWATIYNNLR